MRKIYYLKPVFNFILIGLLILTLNRIFLFTIFNERVIETEHYFQLFSIGLRFDLILP